MQRSLIVISLFALPICSFAAVLHSMNSTQLKQAFVGKTLTSIGVDNLNGKTINTSNAVYLAKNGIAYGKLGAKPENLPQYDMGHYRITNNGTIYLTWQHWDFAKRLCFNIFETKNAYLSVDCSGVYHSTFMKSASVPGNTLVQKNHN